MIKVTFFVYELSDKDILKILSTLDQGERQDYGTVVGFVKKTHLANILKICPMWTIKYDKRNEEFTFYTHPPKL